MLNALLPKDCEPDHRCLLLPVHHPIQRKSGQLHVPLLNVTQPYRGDRQLLFIAPVPDRAVNHILPDLSELLKPMRRQHCDPLGRNISAKPKLDRRVMLEVTATGPCLSRKVHVANRLLRDLPHCPDHLIVLVKLAKIRGRKRPTCRRGVCEAQGSVPRGRPRNTRQTTL